MRHEALRSAYQILCRVYNKRAYANIELNACKTADSATYFLVYGVLENNILLDYYINKLVQKKPQNNVLILLKLGIYLQLFSNKAQYFSVNAVLELAKSVGKGAVCGFLNAVFRKIDTVKLPDEQNWKQYYSIKYSYPLFLIDFLQELFDEQFIKDLISFKEESRICIRPNISRYDCSQFANLLDNNGIKYMQGKNTRAFYVEHDQLLRLNQICKGDFFVQGESSMFVCETAERLLKDVPHPQIYDCCAAPGGKSVYLSQLVPHGHVFSSDVLPHRVQLLQGYVQSAHANIEPFLADATQENAEFLQKFDLILCDAPCSGLGVSGSKPDILLNRSKQDILSLCELQQSILANVAKYVKKGGYLVYSTCTYLPQENEAILQQFLSNFSDFSALKLNGYGGFDAGDFVRFFRHIDGVDGFFVGALQRK